MNNFLDKTICANSTSGGVGAIAIIRVSGCEAFEITKNIVLEKEVFYNSDFRKMIFCTIINSEKEIIDEVLIAKYKAPNSYTGENLVEIFCHGSIYIQKEIIRNLIIYGAIIAKPGEFTFRAFLNGKIDLAQSEAVADIISSDTLSSHRLAIKQMKGNVSSKINSLREEMINILSLLELELDFVEEDVEFADRDKLIKLCNDINNHIDKLLLSFKYGNAIKNGIPIAIVGTPNSGKSTLLNVFLQEERAIVTDIPGTTRDTIEEELIVDGIKFKIIDTAGIRKPENIVEDIGIKKSLETINKAKVILLINDITCIDNKIINEITNLISDDQKLIIIYNKIDLLEQTLVSDIANKGILISAKLNQNTEQIFSEIMDYVNSFKVDISDTIISNIRHYQSLELTKQSLNAAILAFKDDLSSELVAQDIREAMYYLGEITGEISNEDILGNIFSKFCIGK